MITGFLSVVFLSMLLFVVTCLRATRRQTRAHLHTIDQLRESLSREKDRQTTGRQLLSLSDELLYKVRESNKTIGQDVYELFKELTAQLSRRGFVE